MSHRSTTAAARCVLREDGHLGCSTRRWEERLIVSDRLLRETRRHGDLADLFRALADQHGDRLPREVRLGFERSTSLHSETLGVTLVAVSRCQSQPPSWAPRLSRRRQNDGGCRLYTFMGFSQEV